MRRIESDREQLKVEQVNETSGLSEQNSVSGSHLCTQQLNVVTGGRGCIDGTRDDPLRQSSTPDVRHSPIGRTHQDIQ